MSRKLDAFYIPADDIDIYGVEEEGWYAVDEEYRVVDGPFASHQACLKAVEEAAKAA